MRYTKPSNGDKKVKTFFAILPVRVDKETRWFEWVTVGYTYKVYPWTGGSGWESTCFIDERGEENEQSEN